MNINFIAATVKHQIPNGLPVCRSNKKRDSHFHFPYMVKVESELYMTYKSKKEIRSK